ncbi:MAG TPA: ATP-binding protein [Terriglobia bacterium]|nr:ATP-binding protein [Terriglobia bacterium]
MRVSLKVKLTALIALLVLVVVLATSVLYLVNSVRQTFQGVEQIGSYIRDDTYARARGVVATTRIPPYIDPKDFHEVQAFIQVRLSQDASLRSLMESAVTYSPVIDYVAITNNRHMVLAHNLPSMTGQTLPAAPPLSELLHAGLLRQLRMIYGPIQDYELELPLAMNKQPFCTVRVGISTVFLAAQVTPHLRGALDLAGLVILLATLTAGILSFRILRPLVAISQNLDRLTRGEIPAPVKHRREDEWGALSSKLNLLGERMRGEKAAYLALRENLDQLFSNLVDGMMLFDSQDRLVLATPSAARLLLRPTEGLIHHKAHEIFSGSGPMNELLREAFQSKKPLVGQMVDLPENATTPRVAVTAHFVYEKGHQVASLVTLRDAGTRAQLEDQIGVAAKLTALARLTSGVAHEVKNPLNAMILQVEILKSKLLDQGEEVQPQLEVLSKEIRRLDRVVKTFLDFTRPMEIRRAETNLTDVVQEVFTLAEPQAQKQNVRLILERNGDLPPLKVDRDLIKQALLNLVLNGCQAMPAGGDLRVKPSANSKSVELEIADQGMGIPEEDRQRIFSLFYTTKPGGSGIGLAMVFRIVQLHDGSIDFSSELHQGTTFRISLPI